MRKKEWVYDDDPGESQEENPESEPSPTKPPPDLPS